ncbi:MlaD family protein [Patulibacter sp. SYSU D01012]|uniref:MlaD family protein n=1 Tax=Patulibacter sp. SYSU D01012 TaxID=2817381 RepID=UPI0032C1DE02
MLALAGGGALAGCGSGDGERAGTVRVDAIFDNASFVGKGQDVRVAGATVGKVAEVSLTPDRKARVSMDVEREFTPFRRDADCTILPQSLIGEKFVECDPGRPDAPALRATKGGAPTVPLSGTHSPVDLDLVVAMLGAPTNARFQLLMNEFGAGISTRGEELDEIIRRANPTLQYAKQTLDVLGRDKAALGRIVEASDEILGELEKREDDLNGTFEASADVLKVTSDYRRELDRAIRDLPPTLDDLKPALESLRDLSRDTTPTLRSLRAAAPSLRELSGDLGPLTDAARPALKSLADAATEAVPILQRSVPELQRIQTATRALAPSTPLLADLLRSLSDNGFPENFSTFVFNTVMATARKDDISHIVPANLILNPCILSGDTPTKGCNARFSAEATGDNRLGAAQARSYQRLVQGRADAERADGDEPAATETTPSPAPTTTTGGAPTAPTAETGR